MNECVNLSNQGGLDQYNQLLVSYRSVIETAVPISQRAQTRARDNM